MVVKKFLSVLLFFFLSTNVAFAANALSYEKERAFYLKELKDIIFEATHSGIKTDVKLSEAKTKEEKAAKLEKLKQDALKGAKILDKNKDTLAKLKLKNFKLIAVNEKITASFSQSANAMRNIAKDIEDYNVLDFLKNLVTLKQNENVLKESLQEINAEYLLEKK